MCRDSGGTGLEEQRAEAGENSRSVENGMDISGHFNGFRQQKFRQQSVPLCGEYLHCLARHSFTKDTEQRFALL